MIKDRYMDSMSRYARPSVDPSVQAEIDEIKEAIKALFYCVDTDYDNDYYKLMQIISKWESE